MIQMTQPVSRYYRDAPVVEIIWSVRDQIIEEALVAEKWLPGQLEMIDLLAVQAETVGSRGSGEFSPTVDCNDGAGAYCGCPKCTPDMPYPGCGEELPY